MHSMVMHINLEIITPLVTLLVNTIHAYVKRHYESELCTLTKASFLGRVQFELDC